MTKGEAICGSPASKHSSGDTLALTYSNHDDKVFVTGGHANIRVWQLDEEQRKIIATDCQTGQIKRVVKCIIIDANDEFVYCGTTTGDLLQISLKSKLFKQSGPPKDKVKYLKVFRWGEFNVEYRICLVWEFIQLRCILMNLLFLLDVVMVQLLQCVSDLN